MLIQSESSVCCQHCQEYQLATPISLTKWMDRIDFGYVVARSFRKTSSDFDICEVNFCGKFGKHPGHFHIDVLWMEKRATGLGGSNLAD